MSAAPRSAPPQRRKTRTLRPRPHAAVHPPAVKPLSRAREGKGGGASASGSAAVSARGARALGNSAAQGRLFYSSATACRAPRLCHHAACRPRPRRKTCAKSWHSSSSHNKVVGDSLDWGLTGRSPYGHPRTQPTYENGWNSPQPGPTHKGHFKGVESRAPDSPLGHFEATEDQRPFATNACARLDDANGCINKDDIAFVVLDKIKAQTPRHHAKLLENS